MPKSRYEMRPLDLIDRLLALGIGLVALIVYVRTLAPGLLYGDSAEFQTLTYTLGMTHSTGYPIYLLLARGIGVLPLRSPAWRVNLFSAVSAAVAIGCSYHLARRLTRSRIGGLLAGLILAVSYTFWTQAIIAEVYTPAIACYLLSLHMLWRWDAHRDRPYTLLVATLLMSAGLGIHASVVLLIPPAGIFIVQRIWRDRAEEPHWQRERLLALSGGVLGLLLFVGTFLLIDLNDPPSSFINTVVIPSRSIWGLTLRQLQSPWRRLWITVTGLQWRDAMFPGGLPAVRDRLAAYAGHLPTEEFSWVALICAGVGLVHALRKHLAHGLLVLGAYLFALVAVLNYDPPDWTIFFLPTYVLIAVTAGVGAGEIARAPVRWLTSRSRLAGTAVAAILALFLTAGLVRPFAASRWRAIRTGRADFSRETYVYPVDALDEPRQRAAIRLSLVSDDAMLLLDWRSLYATAYIAYVEGKKPNVTMVEAAPHGSEGQLADSMILEIEEALNAGRDVLTYQMYRQLRGRFRVMPAPGGQLYRVTLPDNP